MAIMSESTQKLFDQVVNTKYAGNGNDALLGIANDPNASADNRREALQEFLSTKPNSTNPLVASARRLQDMDTGEALGKRFVGEGSLGRLTEGRSSEVADLIAERRKAYETSPQGGLSSEEMQGFRDQAVQNINKTSETARRRLAGVQSQTGVRGATAATQQMGAIQAGNTERTNFERDLFLRQRDALQQDRAEQSAKLGALESSVLSARANEEATQKFNLEQVARERFAQLSTALSYAGLGATERGSALAAASQEAAARAAAPGKGGLLSKLF